MYVLLKNGGVKRVSDGAIIPEAVSNRHWGEYLKWVEDGNTPIQVKPSQYHTLVDGEWILSEEKQKESDTVDGETEFKRKIKLGFEYEGNVYQCAEDDLVLWQRGVILMERHGFAKTNAVDIDNGEHSVTLAQLKQISEKAEDTYFTRWFEYQGIKNGTT